MIIIIINNRININMVSGNQRCCACNGRNAVCKTCSCAKKRLVCSSCSPGKRGSCHNQPSPSMSMPRGSSSSRLAPQLLPGTGPPLPPDDEAHPLLPSLSDVCSLSEATLFCSQRGSRCMVSHPPFRTKCYGFPS